MKRYVCVFVLALTFIAVKAQEPCVITLSADSMGSANPIEIHDRQPYDIRPLSLDPINPGRDNITFDNTGIMEMHRTLLSEIPKYPVVRIGSGLNAYPFLSSERSRFMGVDMAGIGTRIDITNWLSADVSAFLSGAYMGSAYPKKYMNASAATTLRIKLHDRVYLIGTGQISAREGLDPRIAPGIGGKNSLGAGVEIWITEKFGITVTRTWEHYQGGWHGHYGYGPIGR